jgi:hypothetical protein
VGLFRQMGHKAVSLLTSIQISIDMPGGIGSPKHLSSHFQKLLENTQEEEENKKGKKDESKYCPNCGFRLVDE